MVAQKEAFLDFLGLKRNPFPVSPDNEYFFLPSRIDALIAEILHSIFTRKGFLVITGEVGLGKTTISQRILRLLDGEGVESALVFNTFLQGSDLLNEVVRDFGIACEEPSLQARLEALNRFLIDRYASGKNCAIIIDDAQNLSTESLELIRMISNLETNAEKLVQILLVGQPELIDKLNTHEMRQLKSRVVIHAEVLPLSQEELKQYVYFKLSTAGSQGGVQISDRIFRIMHALTGGNPRRINNLMDRCLYGLFAYNTHRISRRLLLEVAAEVGFGMPRWPWKRWLAWGGSGVVVAAGAAWIVLHPGLLTSLVSGSGAVSAELAKAKAMQRSAEVEAAKARAAQEKAHAEEVKAQAAQEAARTEIAQARQTQERARLEVSQAQIREAQALTRVAQNKDGKEGQLLQEGLAQARKMREEAEGKLSQAEKTIAAATEESRRQEELLRQSAAARQRGEQEGARAQEELIRIKAAIQEQTKALSQAFADQEKAQAETAEARKQEAQARAEAEARTKETAELAKQNRDREEKLNQAKELREKAEAEANKARAEAAQALAQVEDVKKNAQVVVTKIKQELAERESAWQKERRRFLEDARAARAEAEARIADSEKRAGAMLTEFRQSLAAAGGTTRDAGRDMYEKRLNELDKVRKKAETDALGLRTEVEKALAKAESAQQRAEELQKEYQKKQTNLTGDQAQNQLLELQKARDYAENEALGARRQIAAMQEQARFTQLMVDELPGRLQASGDGSAPVPAPPPPPEMLRFLAHYGLESFAAPFARALKDGALEPIAQRIARDSGYRLVQLDQPPPEADPAGLFAAHASDGSGSRHLLFWKPPFWMDVVYFGQTGEEVRKLQEALAAKGIYTAPVDGMVGKYTLSALARFQKMAGIPLTGRPDSATLFLLTHPSRVAVPTTSASGPRGTEEKGDSDTKPRRIPSPPPRPAAGADATRGEEMQWVVQVASLDEGVDPDDVIKHLKDKGFNAFGSPVRSREGDKRWTAVRVGPVASRDQAETLSKDLARYFKQERLILEFHPGMARTDGRG
ncbi:MAG: AAA family ATPase [Magnetococcales bacterium]|nr:AAA family ATPase [Magnetococcales bacterium]